MDQITRDRLTDAVLSIITADYQLPNGERIQGQSISYLSSELRGRGWKNVSNIHDLETTVERLGFRVVRAQGFVWNSSRKPGSPQHKLGAPARVVTL